jgi:hypothetical protein
VWVEKDFTNALNPKGYLASLGQSQRKAFYAREDIPVAVAVSDIKGDQPRMVVIGNAFIASNLGLARRENENYYPFLENCLDWLLGRGERLGIPPLKSGRFQLDVATIEPKLARMRWLPIWLMGVAIVGLGIGVWVVRRR